MCLMFIEVYETPHPLLYALKSSVKVLSRFLCRALQHKTVANTRQKSLFVYSIFVVITILNVNQDNSS